MEDEGLRLWTGPKVAYDEFRMSVYNPYDKILPWKTPLTKKLTAEEEELANWKKSVKPNAKDYPLFKDEALWIKYQEKFTTTIRGQGLEHLIDRSYVVSNPELDEKQCN